MDSVSGWAGKMFMKQKMGQISDCLPYVSCEQKKGKVTSREMRKDIKASRAERDAAYERRKADRVADKVSMKDRWAMNKAANK